MAKIRIRAIAAGGDVMDDGTKFARVKSIHGSQILDESYEGGRPYLEYKCVDSRGKALPELANSIKAYLLSLFEKNPGKFFVPEIEITVSEVVIQKKSVNACTGFDPLNQPKAEY
jgi:hypothetical protein